MTPSLTYSPLKAFALLKVEGDDALTFLQSQLSQDIRLVTGNRALLASYSLPNGRVLSTFLLWQGQANTYYALLPNDNAVFMQRRLSMFILRAKLSISIENVTITGIWGEHISSKLPSFIQGAVFNTNAVNADSVNAEAHDTLSFTVVQDKEQGNDFFAITYPSADQIQRLLLVQLSKNSAIFSGTEANDDIWYAQDIEIGLPWIGNSNKEKHLAQALNQDVIGAINFKKGCYPGQEVIARLHYRGGLKKRSVIGYVPEPRWPSSELIGTDIIIDGKPVGVVVNAANKDNLMYLLFEITISALLENAILTLDKEPYPRINQLDMPYGIKAG